MATIKLNGTKVIAAIDKLQKLISKPAEFIHIRSEDNTLVISAISELFRGEVRVEVECKKGIKFSTNALTFAAICKKRDNLIFNVEKDNAIITFSDKHGKYTGDFKAVPYTAIVVLEEKTKSTLVLKEELRNTLLSIIPKVSISSYLNDITMTVMIRLIDGNLKIIVADVYHFAIHTQKIKSKTNLKLDLPIAYIKTISDIGDNDGNLNIASDNSSIYIWNNTISVALPHIAAPKNLEFDIISKHVQTFNKFENVISIDSAKLSKILDNLNGVHEDGSSIKATMKKTLQLEIKTSFGKISDSIDGKIEKSNGDKISLDIHNITDIVQLLSGNVLVKFFGKKITVIESSDEKTKSKTTYISTNL